MRPKQIISPRRKVIATEQKKSEQDSTLSPDNPKTKNTVIAIIIAATIAVSTFASSKFLDENITRSEWYWIIIVAGATICLVGWVQKRIQIESAKVVCIIVLCLALPMLILSTIWPGTTLPELKKKISTTPVAKSQLQIIPQVSKGWKVDSEGRLVAKLQPGEEEQRVFRISEGYSTPWFVLPPEKYRFRADYQQTVIVEEKGRDKKIVHPNDLDNRGITQGSRREFRFTALKGGAEIIITLRRI